MFDDLYAKSLLLWRWMRRYFPEITVQSLSWLAIVLLHMATVPGLLSVMLAWTDDMPQLDIVLLTWGGLVALFAQAMVQRNMLLIATNTAGFMFQSLIMALIFFR